MWCFFNGEMKRNLGELYELCDNSSYNCWSYVVYYCLVVYTALIFTDTGMIRWCISIYLFLCNNIKQRLLLVSFTTTICEMNFAQ